MNFLFLIEGFFAKIITGADDMLTHTPLVVSLTKSRRGKLVFISGMFTSIFILIVISMLFGNLLRLIPYKNIISAVLLLMLAAFVYYSRFIHARKEANWIQERIPKEPKKIMLFFMGLLVFFITGIDDIVVYSSLLVNTFAKQLLVAAGILIAAVLELIVVFHFSKKISKIKHIEKITIIGLIILSVLVGFKIL